MTFYIIPSNMSAPTTRSASRSRGSAAAAADNAPPASALPTYGANPLARARVAAQGIALIVLIAVAFYI